MKTSHWRVAKMAPLMDAYAWTGIEFKPVCIALSIESYPGPVEAMIATQEHRKADPDSRADYAFVGPKPRRA